MTILTFFDSSNFWIVNWYYLVALTISIFGATIAYKNYKKRGSSPPLPTIDNRPSNRNISTITVNVGPQMVSSGKGSSEQRNDHETIKKTTSILFIDDDTKFKVVKILVNEGWINTKSITDLKSYNDDIIKNSNIVFVDVQGVGKVLDCKDEGLGLALNIKSKYPEKKVIIYSAVQGHNVFHDAIQKVDFLLSKDAEPYEFISLIERLSREIK